jgi:hypothetical protein
MGQSPEVFHIHNKPDFGSPSKKIIVSPFIFIGLGHNGRHILAID